jgi:2-amino-4-hydroxy-6-hydroxymethyldihydropteridine diphosphokinase
MIFLGIGSSIGNAKQIFCDAEQFLEKNHIHILQKSSVLKNPPFGGIAQNDFSNAVWEISVPKDMTPQKLLLLLKNAEQLAGRDFNTPQWSDRPLDIDILIWNEEIIKTPNLTIPHPGIAERNFVLKPLAELVDENFKIPTLGTFKSLIKK